MLPTFYQPGLEGHLGTQLERLLEFLGAREDRGSHGYPYPTPGLQTTPRNLQVLPRSRTETCGVSPV